MLLIYPPMAKACEPPAGLPLLAGALRAKGYPCTMLDANLEGQLHLLRNNLPGRDTWSRRAHRRLAANLEALRDPRLYAKPARYHRAVSDLDRVLGGIGRDDLTINLANYRDHAMSPVKSGDLLRAADHPAKNIFYDYFAARLDGLLEEHPPPMVGFSINYLSQALTAFAMIGYIKKKHPALPTVAGGGLITSWLSSPEWHDPFKGLIDHLVSGPGEGPLLKLLAGQTETPDNPGHFSAGLRLTENSPAQNEAGEALVDRGKVTGADDATSPDFKGLPLADYLAPGLILPYAASSGCYWRKCSFCPEKAEGNSYRGLPPDVVLAQLAKLTAATEPSLIHFLDNAISPALMQALIANPPGPDWYSFARAEAELTDLDFCRALRRAGCVMLKLGLESGDQGVLDAMHKGIDLNMVAKILANLEKAGIATYVYLLFGTPAESLAEARRTLEFTVRHSSAITFLNLAIFNMPLFGPDTAALAKGGFYEGDLSLYTDFEHPLGWNRRKIRRFLDREFKRHPAISPIIRRDPPYFTSNHAPFFVPATP
jgi:radical SAM superfamily enzyme YgiQ (UPF0313 family)